MATWARTKRGRLGVILQNNGRTLFVKPFDAPKSRENWLVDDLAKFIDEEEQKGNKTPKINNPRFEQPEDSCPNCQASYPSYVSGVRCPNCDYREHFSFKDFLSQS